MAKSQKISKQDDVALVVKEELAILSQTKKRIRKQPEDKILQDLEAMYQAAFESKNFAVALRVLELRGKQLGMFMDKKPELFKSLEQMSEKELRALLND